MMLWEAIGKKIYKSDPLLKVKNPKSLPAIFALVLGQLGLVLSPIEVAASGPSRSQGSASEASLAEAGDTVVKRVCSQTRVVSLADMEQGILPYENARRAFIALARDEHSTQQVQGCKNALAQGFLRYLEAERPKQKGGHAQTRVDHRPSGAILLLAVEAHIPHALAVLRRLVTEGDLDALTLLEHAAPQVYSQTLLGWAEEQVRTGQPNSRGPSWFLIFGRYLNVLKSVDLGAHQSAHAPLSKDSASQNQSTENPVTASGGEPENTWKHFLKIVSVLPANEKALVRPDVKSLAKGRASAPIATAFRQLDTETQARLMWITDDK